MRHDDLPQRWKSRIENYVIENGSKYSQKYKTLSASDFPADLSVKITFLDGSYALFKYAFYLIDAESREVAVFTEHCGYHIFYLGEILLETLDWDKNTIKTDDFRTE